MTKDELKERLAEVADRYKKKVEECHRLRERIKTLEGRACKCEENDV